MKTHRRFRRGFSVTVLAVSSCFAAVVGCDRGQSGSSGTVPPSWPPRTHRLDSEARAVPASASLSLEVDAAGPIRWSGKQETKGGRFIPVQGEFNVEAC